MIRALSAIRHIAAAFAGAASLGLLVTPAWSSCTPPKLTAGERPPFRAADEFVHASTGLTWQRCSVGQHFDDGACSGAASQLTWEGAQKAAAAAGDDWRLPSQAELKTLLASYCSEPAIDTAVFPETPASKYWSATADGAQGAWYVDFEQGGGNGATLRSTTAAVRLVRNRHENERERER